jgi:hypothetical protein
LRQQPSLTAKTIELLPHKSKVRLLQTAKTSVTIDGLTGQWQFVRAETSGKEGWVFGAYLADISTNGQAQSPPLSAEFESERGGKIKYESKICPEEACLIFNAAGYHAHYWTGYKNTETSFSGEKDGFIPGPHARKILQNPTAFVKIEYLQGQLAVILHQEMGRGTPIGRHTLWLLQENTWGPHPQNITGTELTWSDFNSDGIRDLFVEDFVGEAGTFYVYLGSKNQKFEKAQEVFAGYVKTKRFNGSCEANEIVYMAIADHSYSNEVRATFDCTRKEFLVRETLQRE